MTQAIYTITTANMSNEGRHKHRGQTDEDGRHSTTAIKPTEVILDKGGGDEGGNVNNQEY